MENSRKRVLKEDVSTRSTTAAKEEDEPLNGYVEKSPTEIFKSIQDEEDMSR